ncbi:MAG TPA: non-heme iron oxygenase ferredoxin subunit [Candidatus Eisenbacteria bacterium]|nr:non-heme iron oxygenase ferredoxin subunit [Candidatus Eisenbacteria bacterium]
MPKTWVVVARVEEVPPGEVRTFDTPDGGSVAVCNANGKFYAVEDVCTHDGGPLGEGFLEGCAIECPRHGAQFDIRTGEVLRAPAYLPIRVFPVRVENGSIWVEADSD